MTEIDGVVFEHTRTQLTASINGNLVMTRKRDQEWMLKNNVPLSAGFRVTAALVKLREAANG